MSGYNRENIHPMIQDFCASHFITPYEMSGDYEICFEKDDWKFLYLTINNCKNNPEFVIKCLITRFGIKEES